MVEAQDQGSEAGAVATVVARWQCADEPPMRRGGVVDFTQEFGVLGTQDHILNHIRLVALKLSIIRQREAIDRTKRLFLDLHGVLFGGFGFRWLLGGFALLFRRNIAASLFLWADIGFSLFALQAIVLIPERLVLCFQAWFSAAKTSIRLSRSTTLERVTSSEMVSMSIRS
ncbi:hypothetical protein D5085_10330 [Ectothiorhodospiraceae bacterium BW-2]|nr:hypothetical protein D5085_10330 [Ectothiorhodospiraceae bacterium BW-2]